MLNNGRIDITTNYKFIDETNVIKVLQKSIGKHRINVADIDFLLDYDAGEQPLNREKKVRPDIDCQCVDNVASEVSLFWIGYQWGNPPMFVQRIEENEEQPEKAEAVKMLNDCMIATKHKQDSQKNGRYVEISGIGNTYIDVNMEYEEGDSYFTRDVLDPRTSFVVKSSYYPDHRPMMGVTFYKDDDGVTMYTCFTKTHRYEIKSMRIVNGAPINMDDDGYSWFHADRSGEKNPLGRIPIIEWFRSYDRMGVFERQVSECDNLNLMISDFSNDVDQNTQSVWWTNDIEFPQRVVKHEDGTETVETVKPKNGDWLQSQTTQDGKTPIAQPLTVPYDYQGMLNNILARRQLILQKCNVPVTSDSINGSTGVATDSAFGWTKTENASNEETMILDGCRMDELKVILSAIKISPFVPQDSPLLDLKYSDVQITTRRAKQYELSSAINFICTGLAHGIAALPLFKIAGIFPDPNEVWSESRDTIEKYQESVFKVSDGANMDTEKEPNSDRLSGDLSDQINNSPNIDGLNTGGE